MVTSTYIIKSFWRHVSCSISSAACAIIDFGEVYKNSTPSPYLSTTCSHCMTVKPKLIPKEIKITTVPC